MATKKAFIILLVVFLIGSVSLFAQVKSKVDAALAQFAREYPEYAGKAYTTSENDRTWDSQMDIVLRDGNPNNYQYIKKDFTAKFGLTFPVSQSMTSDMRNWWRDEILKPSRGFQHVTGDAVDVSVKYLDSKGTQLLAGILKNNGLSILYEAGQEYKHSYFVGTLLLHCSN